jgi:uncharacterized membrane protein
MLAPDPASGVFRRASFSGVFVFAPKWFPGPHGRSNSKEKDHIMDPYLVAKFLHVALAVIWLGGGFILMLLGLLAARAGNRDDFLTILRLVAVVGTRVFLPGSIAVLILGLVMVWLGGWTWDAWIVIGLAGFVVAAGIGATKLGPTSEAVARLVAEGQLARAEQMGREMFRYAKIEYVIQAVIVFVMVVKPTWGETGILAALGICAGLAVTAILFAPKQAAAA